MEEMTLKELKDIATKAGIEFKKNATKEVMLQLLAAYNEGVKDEKGNEVVEVVIEPKVEEKKEKVYAGLCVKTGKKIFL